jgi:hypothetical protein
MYHENLIPVAYVTADVAAAIKSPVYAVLKLPEVYSLEQHTTSQPFRSDRSEMKWDGGWHISCEILGDRKIAFARPFVESPPIRVVLSEGPFARCKAQNDSERLNC